MENYNLQLFNFFNAGASLNKSLFLIASFCATYLIYFIPFLLIINWFWGTSKQRYTILFALISTLLVLLINYLIGIAWFHPRPFVEKLGHTYLYHDSDSSFPSDHVSIIWTVGISFLIQSRQLFLSITILLMALLTGLARVFLGIHFPFDILGSIVLSTLNVVLLYWWLSPWIRNKLLPIAEKIYQKMFGKLIALRLIKY